MHARYKGLATKAEAEKWFNVLPPKSAKNVNPLNAAKNAWHPADERETKADGRGAGAVARGVAASRSGLGRSNGVKPENIHAPITA